MPRTPVRAAPDPLVGAWLVLVCVLVAAMIAVGGATRLTDSGLSITEWDLAKQLWPPMSDRRWLEEFALYQRTTEYQTVNRAMSMAEFQVIYWWEWGHRFLGKVVGAAFALPFFAFWATGRLKGRFWPCLGLFALGGLQGAIGWWMVTSGLFGRVDVSPVRLAVHLGMAFLILGVALALALQAFGWPRQGALRSGPPRALVWALLAAMFCQILLGALVAGLDAGRAYTDWPTLGGEWFPSSYAGFEPFVRNLTDNPAAVQWNHRVFGYLTACLALYTAALCVRAGGVQRALGAALAALAVWQTALGVATVLNAAPLGLSLLHQGSAVALWGCVVGIWAAQHRREPVTAPGSVGLQEVAERA